MERIAKEVMAEDFPEMKKKKIHKSLDWEKS